VLTPPRNDSVTPMTSSVCGLLPLRLRRPCEAPPGRGRCGSRPRPEAARALSAAPVSVLRFAVVRGGGSRLLRSHGEEPWPVRQRCHVQIDQGQHPPAAQFKKFRIVESVQLLLVNAVERAQLALFLARIA